MKISEAKLRETVRKILDEILAEESVKMRNDFYSRPLGQPFKCPQCDAELESCGVLYRTWACGSSKRSCLAFAQSPTCRIKQLETVARQLYHALVYYPGVLDSIHVDTLTDWVKTIEGGK
jgi:hypothetical protein